MVSVDFIYIVRPIFFWDYARYIPHEVWHADTYYFTGRSINEFMQGWLSTFSLGCLLFLVLDRQQRMG